MGTFTTDYHRRYLVLTLDLRSVCAFVSLCSYYRNYIWRFAEISAPLTDLLKDGQWRSPSTPDVFEDAERLKAALISTQS